MLNKLLQRQLQKYLTRSGNGQPVDTEFLNMISETYDHYEKDHKMLERSIELSSTEMIEMNTKLRKEADELKKAEALKKAHRELARVFDSVDECLYSMDMTTYRFIQVSAACEKIFGYTQSEFFANSNLWQEVILPEDRTIIDKNNKRVYAGEHVTQRFRITHKNGEIRWLCSNVTPVFNESRKLVRIDGVVSDITESKLAEEKIIMSNRLYSFISLVNQTIVHVKDENSVFKQVCRIATNVGKFKMAWIGKIDRVNKKTSLIEESGIPHDKINLFTKICYEKGNSQDIVLQSGNYIVCDHLETDFKPEEWKSFIADNNILSSIVLPIKKSGKVIASFNLYSSEKKTFDAEEIRLLEEVAGDISFAIDNFEKERMRQEVEETVKQSEANLKLIMDLVPQSIFAKDITGKYIFVNKSFAELYGLDPDQLIDKKIKTAIPVQDEADNFLKEDQEVILSGTTKISPEQTFTDYKGEKRFFYTVKVPFTPAGKNIKAVLGISLDITERKQAELEKERITADLVQHNSDLKQFAYIVSHNLRAPVANIIGFTESLAGGELDAELQKEVLNGLSESTLKLNTIILDLNQILDVKNNINGMKESVKFSDLVTDIRNSLSHLVKKEDVDIKTDFTEIDELFTLNSYLYSIFYNLISNSIKYRQPSVPLLIQIKSKITGGNVILNFKDNGMGIDLNKRNGQVFGLYKRFHPQIEGKGMGLFMVKTQVETLGGKINILSEVNKGTQFNIEFSN